jgi:KaiC/GvpD/RAD55 family RecA-like ATPase
MAEMTAEHGKGDRIPTGVEGFDSLVEGGLRRGTNVLITGVPGTGKTIFGMNYLYKGAQLGENGLYISIDSSSEQLKLQGLRFGWDLAGMEKAGKLFFLKIPLNKIKFNLFDIIENIKKEINAERVVFDNLATFAINAGFFEISMNEETESKAPSAPFDSDRIGGNVSGAETNEDSMSYSSKSERHMAYMIVEKLADLGTTNLIITYGGRNGGRNPSNLTVDGVSEFSCDGIIALHNELIGNKHIRTMEILKMRATAHSPYLHDFEFGKNGIVVKPVAPVYK